MTEQMQTNAGSRQKMHQTHVRLTAQHMLYIFLGGSVHREGLQRVVGLS